MSKTKIQLNINAKPFKSIFHYQEENQNIYRTEYDDLFSNSIDTECQLENFLSPKITTNYNCFDYLLSTPNIVNSDNDNQKINKKKFTLKDFLKRNVNNLKEDLLYYFSSPESLLNFKNSLDEGIKHDFCKDLDYKNFLITQKERFRYILANSKPNLYPTMKISKLSNFNDSFCTKVSFNQNKEKINNKLKKANLIGTKLDECFYLASQHEIKNENIITALNELKSSFILNLIDIESFGLINFNFIEKNLIYLLKIIELKFVEKRI